MPASHSDIYRAPSVCPALGWVRLWGDRDYSREWRLRLRSWVVHRARGTVGGLSHWTVGKEGLGRFPRGGDTGLNLHWGRSCDRTRRRREHIWCGVCSEGRAEPYRSTAARPSAPTVMSARPSPLKSKPPATEVPKYWSPGATAEALILCGGETQDVGEGRGFLSVLFSQQIGPLQGH